MNPHVLGTGTIGAMKLIYIFGAILACNIIAIVLGGRGTKTAWAGVSAALAGYGVFRLLG